MSTPSEADNLAGSPVGCPSPEVLEEHAVLRERRRLHLPESFKSYELEVERHVLACAACTERLATLAKTSACFVDLLLHAAPDPAASTPSPACIEDEDLAAYLDGALFAAHSRSPESDRAHMETVQNHMAECRRCQGRLVALYRELRAVLAEMPERGEGSTVSLHDARRRQEEASQSGEEPLPVPADTTQELGTASHSTPAATEGGDGTVSGQPEVSREAKGEGRKQRYSSQSS